MWKHLPMRKPGQAIFVWLANRAFLREKVKPFPTVHETVHGKPLRGSARRAAKRKARAEYRSKMTLDDKAGKLAFQITFYFFLSFFLILPAIAAEFTPPGLTNSKFKGRIELGMLFWFTTTYVTAAIFVFMDNATATLVFGGLFFVPFAVLVWLKRNDLGVDFQIPPMNK